MMRLTAFLLLALSSPTKDVVAFSLNQSARSRKGSGVVTSRSKLLSSRSSFVTQIYSTFNVDEDSDCGCASTIYSGKPTEVARASNPRQAIRNGSIYNLDSEELVIDDLLQRKSPVSIVVFLRSLGCPLCQEFILQWSKRVNELEQSGITLVMVSIGTPANGNKLADHLAISNLRDFLYLDPENALYDSLNLNKGLKSTFLSPGTAFAFLRRFTTRGAMMELNEVLPKWSKAIYIPPKQEQALNQGGAFLFDGDETVLAHYDEGTADHCDIQKVIDLATERVKVDQQVLN